MSSAPQSPDAQPSSEHLEGFDVFKNTNPSKKLMYKNDVVGRFCSLYEIRNFLVKPITRIPLGDTELGSCLEDDYSMFDLIVHEGGVITFTLKPNDVLDRVLDAIAWAYSRLLGGKRK